MYGSSVYWSASSSWCRCTYTVKHGTPRRRPGSPAQIQCRSCASYYSEADANMQAISKGSSGMSFDSSCCRVRCCSAILLEQFYNCLGCSMLVEQVFAPGTSKQAADLQHLCIMAALASWSILHWLLHFC